MFARQVVRKFTTSAIRRSGHHDPYDGIPGHNLPFSTQNRHKLLALFMLYVGSGFSIPFLVVRHQLLKTSVVLQYRFVLPMLANCWILRKDYDIRTYYVFLMKKLVVSDMSI